MGNTYLVENLRPATVNLTPCPPLRGCPCCGARPRLIEGPTAFDRRMQIVCPECGVSAPQVYCYTREEFPTVYERRPDLRRDVILDKLAAIWNNRVSTKAQPVEAGA